MTTPHDGWRVRVLDNEDRVCGAGVLVRPDLVLTCAHVVAKALRVAAPDRPPAAPVTIDFPTVAPAGRRAAYVEPEGWVAVEPDRSGDLALLRLDEPVDLDAATLASCGPPSARPVRVFGHPAGEHLGRWALARITGTAGPTGEWVQLNDRNQPGPRIEPGFSGAGVIEEDTGVVIGIIVGSDKAVMAKGAWMMSMEAVAARLPVLRTELRVPEQRTPRSAPVAGPAHRDDYELHLVDSLVALDNLYDATGRTELIGRIEERLGRPLGMIRTPVPRADLRNIVIACLDHPAGSAIGLLADAVRALYGDTPEVDTVVALAAQDPGRRLTDDEQARLEVLMADLPQSEVLDASRYAFGPLGPRTDIDPANLAAITNALAELVGRPGAPPLLVFLRRLAGRLHGPQATALGDWLHWFSERWQLPIGDVAEETGPLVVPQRSFLVVEVREDGPNPDVYLLSIRLQHDNGTGRALAVHDDQPLTLDEITGHVGTHLRRVINRSIEPIGALTIEFVLPSPLLNHPVDQFRVVLEDGARTIGSAYPVVIRSADRMRNHLVRRRWETRSRWLRENGDAYHPQAIKWISLSGANVQSVESRLRQDRDFSDEHPVCLVLVWRNRIERTAPRAIHAALELGVPVLLWCRQARVADQFAAEMANRLNGRAVTDLVGLVHQLRRDAARDRPDDHFGAHLCLVWDDTDRLLPDQTLSAPA